MSEQSSQWAFARGLTDFIFIGNEPEPSDIIFVPGNGYPQMAEMAASFYKKGLAPLVLPSGRYYIYDDGFDGVKTHQEIYTGPYETEWAFLKDVLMINGVPEEAILKEDQASYTYQNAINSRRVTDEAGLEIKRAIICCLAAHARRCLMYYQLLYPETTFFVCPTPANGISRDNWMMSEDGIEIVTGEAERCGGQFRDILNSFLKGS